MKNALIVIFPIFVIICALLGCESSAQRDTPISIGERSPETRFEVSPQDASALGLLQGEIGIEDIPGDLIVLDVLNVYCPACQAQAPVMNELYDIIQADESLRARITIIGVALGNQNWEIEEFKSAYAVEFPIFPDPKIEITRSYGVSTAPYHITIRRWGDELIVAGSHHGAAEDVQKYLADLRFMLELDMTALRHVTEVTVQTESPPLVIDRVELRQLIETSMTARGWNLQNLDEVETVKNGRVFIGTLTKSGTTRTLFGRLVVRDSICETCESVQFAYLFDEKGRITNLIPIQLTKYEQELWTEEDLTVLKRRILGRFVYEPFVFDPRVDAVTSATVTSAMIFNGLNQGTGLYKELKSKGYIK